MRSMEYIKVFLYSIYMVLLLDACTMKNRIKMTKNYADITNEVSVEKFKRIAAAILKNGDRKTYCNKYNNSPHFKTH